MDSRELTQLIDQRFDTLQRLIELGRRQTEAIDAGHMTELMRLLSAKQPLLQQLSQVAESLRQAASDDPKTRQWDDPEDRNRCRRRQDECDRLHLELLAIEAECETKLTESRDSIQKQLQRVDAGRQATAGYASAPAGHSSGGRLDLSSD